MGQAQRLEVDGKSAVSPSRLHLPRFCGVVAAVNFHAEGEVVDGGGANEEGHLQVASSKWQVASVQVASCYLLLVTCVLAHLLARLSSVPRTVNHKPERDEAEQGDDGDDAERNGR